MVAYGRNIHLSAGDRPDLRGGYLVQLAPGPALGAVLGQQSRKEGQGRLGQVDDTG